MKNGKRYTFLTIGEILGRNRPGTKPQLQSVLKTVCRPSMTSPSKLEYELINDRSSPERPFKYILKSIGSTRTKKLCKIKCLYLSSEHNIRRWHSIVFYFPIYIIYLPTIHHFCGGIIVKKVLI